jgi:hypothetical protein
VKTQSDGQPQLRAVALELFPQKIHLIFICNVTGV